MPNALVHSLAPLMCSCRKFYLASRPGLSIGCSFMSPYYLSTVSFLRPSMAPNLPASQHDLIRDMSRKSATIFGQGTIPEPSPPHIGKGVATVAWWPRQQLSCTYIAQNPLDSRNDTQLLRNSYEPGMHYRLKGYESGLAARTLSRYTFF